MELEKQIEFVAAARRVARDKLDQKKASLAKWEEVNQDLLKDVLMAADVVSTAENQLREFTLQAYAETGNKAPAVGVGIREVTKLEYDNKEAFNWAIGHEMALKLDSRAFEKIAKASPLDFVKTYQEPQATIATNLD